MGACCRNGWADAPEYADGSAFKNLIHQHTNPGGVVKDTAIQKVLMNSISDGVMRELLQREGGIELCYDIVNEFYWAVRDAFASDWDGHKPRTSRLVHGAGIVAMGQVMETLAYFENARTRDKFLVGLQSLQAKTAWTSGEWDFGNGDKRTWKAIQNFSGDISLLTEYLVREVKAAQRERLWEDQGGGLTTEASEVVE